MAKPSSPSPTDRKTYMRGFRERQKTDGFVRVTVNLSPDEVARLGGSAVVFKEKLATHLKTLALAKLDDRYLVPPDLSSRLDDLLAIMRGIGTNLNQLARHANEMRYFLDTQEVQLQLKRLDDEVRRFVSTPPKAG